MVVLELDAFTSLPLVVAAPAAVERFDESLEFNMNYVLIINYFYESENFYLQFYWRLFWVVAIRF